MPELPEVETVRRDLEARVVGRRVVDVEVTGRRTIRRQTPADFVSALTGRRFVRIERRGKYLFAPLDDGAALVVHLRMSGQLFDVAAGQAVARAPHTHVVLGFEDSSALHFVDPRTFGELFVTGELDERGVPLALGALGLDPLVDGVTAAQLRALMARRRTSLKAFLLDQQALAGIGNIYADEICFAARLSPARRADTLGPRRTAALASAIAQVLDAAVAARGSTLRDARYRDLDGNHGSYQAHHAVYGRTGLGCPRCATPIVRVQLAGRSAHFCPRCQR